MANLRDIKRRIESVKSTKQITNAMKMVAASKLRRAQDRIIAARPYANYVDLMLRTIKKKNRNTNHALIAGNGDKREILVVVTADKGLCGSFNSNIIKEAKNYLDENPDTAVICLGRKAEEEMKKISDNIIASYIGLFNEMKFTESADISQLLLDLYLEKGYGKIKVLYNEFKSAIQQNLIFKQILPIETNDSDIVSEIDFIYEPDEHSIIDELGKKFVNVDIWRIMLESSAAEQGARMTAMESATDNANDLISSLSLQYNRERQAVITTEIIEISSGAGAINE
ncbi:MAG: ATP synthase F1 subunit gamma [Candidatus Cloacimonadota bacterium]|nr:MAG: ATP synthase F1 subunit gamma [Candidatus Cloacimonadota bacterium]